LVAASRAAAGMGYIGYPAQIFYEKINFNRGPQLHIERLFILDKWYSNLRAYLPILYVANKDAEGYQADIFPKIEHVDKELHEAWDSYKSTFEGEQSFDPQELAFVKQLRTILIDLDEITAISKVIDKQKMTDDMDVIG
jgi:hypothetical protein